MSDRLRVIVEGQDNASDELRRVGSEAQRMGQQVDRGGQQAERGFRGVGRSADDLKNRMTAVGAALGTVVGGMALAGRAAVQQESQIRSLDVIYDESSRTIQDWARSVQDSTNQSDQAARQAAISAGVLADQYDFTADQITTLIDRGNDLSAVYVQADGTQASLTDSAQRLTQALIGEYESARTLGVFMSDATLAAYAASQGFDNWTTTMTDAEKVQLRFQYVMEQTAGVTGAAAAEADTARGQMIRLGNRMQDATAGAGQFLGPAGEVASVLGQWALAAPLAGAGIGRLATGFRSLGAALVSPAGLVVAGGAALASMAALAVTMERDYVPAAERARDTTEDLTYTLQTLAVAGATEQLAAGQDALALWQQIIDTMLAAANAANIARDEIAGAFGPDVVDVSFADAEQALADFEAEYGAAAREIGAITEDFTTDINTILGYTGVNADLVRREMIRLLEAVVSGDITFAEAADSLDNLASHMEGFGAVLPEVTTGMSSLDGQLAQTAGSFASLGDEAADAGQTIRETTPVVTDAATGLNELGGAADTTAEAIGTTEDQLARTLAPLGRFIEGWGNLGEALDANAVHQAEVNAGLTEAARLTADADAARQVALATGQAELEQQRARAQAQRDANEAAYEAEQAAYATAAAISGTIVPLDEAVASMGAVRTGSLLAADGLVTLADQQFFAAATAADLARAQGELSGQIGFYRGALGEMEDAYDILQARIEAGETLNQRELDFYNEYESAAAGATRTLEDLRVEQGILAQAQIDNAQAQESLAETMGETNEQMGELTDTLQLLAQVLAEIAGVNLDNLTPPERTAIAWTEAAQGVKFFRDNLEAIIAGRPAPPNLPPPSQDLLLADSGIAGSEGGNRGPWVRNTLPAFGAPVNLPPPSQTLLSPQQAAVTAVSVPIRIDYGDVETTLQQLAVTIEQAIGEDVTYTLVADAGEVYAVLEDVDGDVRAVVTRENIVYIDGDADGFLSNAEAVELARDAIDGSTATVFVDANDTRFRNTLAGLTGFQGNAYVNVYAIPQGGGPTDLTRREGGAVSAAYGRMVTLAEAGGEWVDTPGGGGFLAAQHGRYVLPGGSYIHPAPVTRDIVGRGVTVVNHFHGVSRRDVPQIKEAVRSGINQAMTAYGR